MAGNNRDNNSRAASKLSLLRDLLWGSNNDYENKNTHNTRNDSINNNPTERIVMEDDLDIFIRNDSSFHRYAPRRNTPENLARRLSRRISATASTNDHQGRLMSEGDISTTSEDGTNNIFLVPNIFPRDSYVLTKERGVKKTSINENEAFDQIPEDDSK